ncbi:MAG: hypothetical protein F4X64_01805 [Chloroflexi bacterium]|nr:hypothetical protein [Chloroflexota bacterium]
MENAKFGDKKDRMKWEVLLELAQRYKIRRIVQVAMLTDDKPPPDVTAEPMQHEHQGVAALVGEFFRNYGYPKGGGLRDIQVLGEQLGIKIEVWLDRFTHQERCNYFDRITDRIREYDAPTVWFFDPDNGIEPDKTEIKHVRQIELRQVFDALPTGDFLAVFQHNQQRPCWDTMARDRFRRACSVPVDQVKVFERPGYKQAIIFAVRKLEPANCAGESYEKTSCERAGNRRLSG